MSDCATTVLLIDAGNTRVKFAYYESLSSTTSEQDQAAASLKFILTHAELAGLASHLASFDRKPALVIGVNVAGPLVGDKIVEQLDMHCGDERYELHWLTSQPQLLHLINSYGDHRQLGADRWLAMLGLSVHQQLQQQPAMLVSFGTATTVDTVFRNQFLGGLIFPGLQLMADSLARGTAQLPAIKWAQSMLPARFPASTAEALESGMIAAQVGAVLRQWSCVVERCELQPLVFYAGGAADYVIPELSRLLTAQASLHGFDTIELFPFEDPALAGLLVYAQHCLQHN
ncbi:MAG: type III pantothenate kinase [Alcaligenaceae bacterium]|nr:type III pantothenate kinase [Alcaligenaceae bacterium]